MPEVCPIMISPAVRSLSVEILMYSVLLFHFSTLPEPDSVNTFSPSIKLFFLSFDVNSGKSPFLITLPEEAAASKTPGISVAPKYSFKLKVIVATLLPKAGLIAVTLNKL